MNSEMNLVDKCCEKCYLIECCCEADRLQVIKDNERARADGYIELDNGKWIKKKDNANGVRADGCYTLYDDEEVFVELNCPHTDSDINELWKYPKGAFIDSDLTEEQDEEEEEELPALQFPPHGTIEYDDKGIKVMYDENEGWVEQEDEEQDEEEKGLRRL
jgi:hypothetical protein